MVRTTERQMKSFLYDDDPQVNLNNVTLYSEDVSKQQPEYFICW